MKSPQLITLTLSGFALISCDPSSVPLREDRKIDASRVIGCYYRENKLKFQIDRDQVQAPNLDVEIKGFFEGKLFPYFSADVQIGYDKKSDEIYIIRRVGVMHEIVFEGPDTFIRLLGSDGVWREFRRSNCIDNAEIH